MGFSQFSPHILALEEKTNTVRTNEMLCIGQKHRQRRTGAGCDGIKSLWDGQLYPFILDGDGKLHALGGRLQEGTFLGCGFE